MVVPPSPPDWVTRPWALFESVVVNANDVVLVTEAEPVDAASGGPRVIYVNPAFTRMTGYEPDEIIGLTPRILQSVRTDRNELDRLRAALLAWEPVEVELLNVHKDGREFWVQINITPVADETGWWTHWVAIQRDITSRKHRELAVGTMLESTSDLIVLLDAGLRIAEVSPSAHRILGGSQASYVGQPLSAIVHPDDSAVLANLLTPTFAPRLGRNATAELRMRHADGTWRWLEIGAADLVRGDGEAGMVFACADITSRRAAQAELQASDERFRGTFYDAPIGMAIKDVEGRIVEANGALVQLLGRSRTELLTLSIEDITHPDDVEAGRRERAALLTGRESRIRHETRFLNRDGAVVGVLHSCSRITGADGVTSHLVSHVEDITERRALERRLRHQALHDGLTGLPNRVLLMDRLEQALAATGRTGGSVALLFIDLDRLKPINDSYGHLAGDIVLQQVARRLCDSIRTGDTACRLAGDEFVVLCHDSSAEATATLVSRINDRLNQPMTLPNAQVSVTASIGIALSNGAATTAEALLQNADAAMYVAKQQGPNHTATFDGVTGGRARARLQLGIDLGLAISASQLYLDYQPVVSLVDREVLGVEALLRWQHPERGLIPPLDFIPLAEDNGLILDLGAWVLDTALVEVARRRAAQADATDHASQGFVMWVNLSGQQLQDPHLIETVRRALTRHDVPGRALGLEITESVLMADVDTATATLRELRAMGVHLSIDDFGTGYSSLSYLAQFPVDTVKIDRSFVNGLDDPLRRRESYAVVNAVVSLAHALRLDIVAEGIETPSQEQALHGLGCVYGQGFLLGRPSRQGRPAATT